MVEDDAAEVAVHTVVKVKHVAGLAARFVTHITASDHIAGERVRRGNEVSPRLAQDAHGWREILVHHVAQHDGHVLEKIASEAATDVEMAHLIPNIGRLVENMAGVADSLDEALWIRSAGTDMKAHTDHVQAEVAGQGKQRGSIIQGGTEFEREAAERC